MSIVDPWVLDQRKNKPDTPPVGYDAICAGCCAPYTYRNAVGLGCTEWKRFCCNTCANRAAALPDTPQVVQPECRLCNVEAMPPVSPSHEVERDAARYRWLRSRRGTMSKEKREDHGHLLINQSFVGWGRALYGDEADAAIDAAMRSSTPEPKAHRELPR